MYAQHMSLRRLVRALLLGAVATTGTAALADGVATPFDYTRTSQFTYYGAADGALNGLLKSETLEPGTPDLCLTTTYTYDAWGNKASSTSANCPGATGDALFTSRTSTQTWNRGTLPTFTLPDGRSLTLQPGQFPLDAKNALSQPSSQLFDPRFGTPTEFTDANGQLTTASYDDLGRKTKETKPDGTSINWRHCVIPGKGLATSTNSAGCVAPAEAPADAVFYVQSWPTNKNGAVSGPWTKVFSDRAGRQIRTATQSFDGPSQPAEEKGTIVVQDDVYDANGVKVVSTQPYWLDTGSSTTTGSNNAGATKTVVDALGRPVQVYTVDAQGTRSGVLFGGSPFSGYGAYGSRTAKLVSISYAGGKTTTTTYYKEAPTGAELSRRRVEEANPAGEVVRVTDNTGAQLIQQRDAFGNLRYTKDALGTTITIDSDLRGRKVKMYEPDAGMMVYAYNALGELVAQSNVKQRTKTPPTRTELAYDKLGRLVQRVDDEYTSNWYYDKDQAGASCRSTGTSIGHLCETATSHGVRRRYWFDGLGRPTSDRMDVANGISAAQRYEWDANNSRMTKRTWPTGLAVSYDYTPLGRVSQMKLVQATQITPLPPTPGGTRGAPVDWAAGKVLWRAETVNAWGRSERHSTGAEGESSSVTTRSTYDTANGLLTNRVAGLLEGTGIYNQGYTYDTLGRLITRVDRNGTGDGADLSETFTYDSLDRLVNYTASHPSIPGAQREVKLTYNALGQLLRRSDLGAYSYTVIDGQTSKQPHALKKFTDLAGNITRYVHDGNGNVISALLNGSDCQGKYCWAAYNSFNQPDSSLGIRGLVAEGEPRYTWQYDQDHARIKETRAITGSGADAGTRTTWRLHPDNAGGLGFEFEDNAPTVATPGNPLVKQARHYLSAGGQALGVFVSEGPLPTLADTAKTPPVITSIALVKVEYWHVDALGSVVSTTDQGGVVTARYSYDPFGQRRFTSGLDDPGQTLEIDWNPAIKRNTGNGYTSHEHLDDIGLIHMNGRMYDPRLGIFLQPDPMLQDPYNLQNYHRYGYCYNNPLGCTDMSGMCFLGCFWQSKAFRAVVSIAAAVYLGPAGAAWASNGLFAGLVTNPLAQSAIAGFVSGAISTGNLKGAVQGAFSSVVFYGAGEVVGGAGLAGMDTPGKFLGAVGVHGVAGCVTNVAAGAKCGPGALSAAFSKAVTPLTGPMGESGQFSDQAQGALVSAAVGGTASVLGGGKFSNGAMTGAYSYLFNALAAWKKAEQMAASSLRDAGWTVEQGVKVVLRGAPGELDAFGVADFIATKDGEVLIGEVKDGLSAKLTKFQKAMLSSEAALGRLEIMSAERAMALGIEAGVPLGNQLNTGARIMYTLSGELGGRAGRQWAAQSAGALATRVLFTGVKIVGGVPFLLLTQPGN